jgi:hypothetical protein
LLTAATVAGASVAWRAPAPLPVSTDTVPSAELATARLLAPFPLRSPSASATGPCPVTSTGSARDRYLNEAIRVLACQAPDLHGALLAAKAAGYAHVIVDGTVIRTDRVRRPGPTPGR